MTCQITHIDDRRGFVFTINREADPVYQVESSAWTQDAYRWSEKEIPKAIRDKVVELEQTGKPGAFVRFLQGDVGVYVICEKNIKILPELADMEISVDPFRENGSGRKLSPYDIVIQAKEGTVRAANGESQTTRAGDYYVIPCQTWGRFIVEEPHRPDFVEITRKMLSLLEELHGHDFLSMSPDKPEEALPPNQAAPQPACFGITCYVLNLSRFTR
ncbi:hypothetical protein [Polyangium sorediatum]|uniref:Uncharacterized protein n=1 Tax=Polyangium sorediatum TaxID=889274 RepID=A0ABT6NPR6_9BACT|nr:hypothetical protein [Polyangium sorediatum]MDI1430202.1 hypothetical protein [Polyangium sorediatum]